MSIETQKYYNHAFDIGFEVVTPHDDESVTKQELFNGLLRRLATTGNELVEACGQPFGSHEETEEGYVEYTRSLSNATTKLLGEIKSSGFSVKPDLPEAVQAQIRYRAYCHAAGEFLIFSNCVGSFDEAYHAFKHAHENGTLESLHFDVTKHIDVEDLDWSEVIAKVEAYAHEMIQSMYDGISIYQGIFELCYPKKLME